MTTTEKIALLKPLSENPAPDLSYFYDILEECGDLKYNYYDYATTRPINCDRELQRLPSADYDTCCALLTMLLREDHFCNGSFEERQDAGQVQPIIDRMLLLLENEG